MSSIKRKLWTQDYFTSYDRPTWTCPTCQIGNLLFKKDWYSLQQTAQAQKQSDEYLAYHPEADESYFVGVIKCNNRSCNENITLIGDSYQSPIWLDESDPRPEYVNHFKPHYFYPSLEMFEISSQCPNNIRKQIRLSFSHYFNDTSAAANSVRTALEMLLDHQKVKKTFTTSAGKRKYYTLHGRIELFGQSNTVIKPFLLAAKWIGNAGSHLGDVSKDAILDGYELLEHCIDELYQKPFRLKELSSKAKTINKKKKPSN